MTILRQRLTPLIQASIIALGLICSSSSQAAKTLPQAKNHHPLHPAHQAVHNIHNTHGNRILPKTHKILAKNTIKNTLRSPIRNTNSATNSMASRAATGSMIIGATSVPFSSPISSQISNTSNNTFVTAAYTAPYAAATMTTAVAYTPAPAPNADHTIARSDDKLSELIARLAAEHDAAEYPQSATLRGKLQNLGQRAGDLAMHAMGMLGINYKRGGSTPETGLDCSGMVRYVFKQALGRDLPRSAAEISNVGAQVQEQDLQPGDLVFYNTMRRSFSHVGIYLGDNKFIHSPSAGGQVRIESMELAYWKKRFDGARRVPEIHAEKL